MHVYRQQDLSKIAEGRMSVSGLGRVKTPMCNLRVEIPSRFRQLEKPTMMAAPITSAGASPFRVSGHSYLLALQLSFSEVSALSGGLMSPAPE
jgi:hypothetical protein